MTRDEFNTRFEPVIAAARRIFNTDDGLALLDYLENQFLYGDLLGETPERTAFNLGARDVVLHFRALRERGRK